MRICLRTFNTAAILIAAVLTSCSRTAEPDQTFLTDSDIALRVNGVTLLKYDPLTWQLGFSPSDNEFQAGDDAMKNWFAVRCSETPANAGQKIDATVSWTSGGEVKSVKDRFEVVKTDGDRFWLWCGKEKTRTAVTVRVLK